MHGDSCGHDHGHGVGHAHAGRDTDRRRLALCLVLVAGYVVAEVVGGWLANSLALLADAGHMLSDVAALGLSLFALWIARRPPDPRRSYGFYRAEILAALANGATLIAVSLFIFVEAFHRLGQPPEVQGALAGGIALGGLIVNLVGMGLLSASRSGSLNVRAAWLHMLADALGSVAALVSGILIWAFGWNLADPLASVLIGLLVIHSSWDLLREAVAILMESTPRGIDLDRVRDVMMGVAGAQEVHDLHVWTITSGMDALSAHVVMTDGRAHEELLRDLRDALHAQVGIDHVTIQLEPGGFEERGAVCARPRTL